MQDDERLQLGATFDLDAEGYDAGRPDYPATVWDIVLAHLSAGPTSHLLEVGPGTGQATKQLLETGARVHAIEPGAGLARVLEARHGTDRLRVDVAPLERAPLDPPYDGVAAATSFHWVDPDVGLPILRAALSPAAPVCLWWLVHRDPAASEPDPIDRVVRSSTALPNTRGLNGILEELDLPARLTDHGFVDVEAQVHRWSLRLDEAALHALFRSFSDFRKREADEQGAILDGLSAVAREHGGVIERPVTCPIVTARAPD